MAFGWLTKETKSSYIARPESAAGELIFLHPDKSIPRGAKLTVRGDECVLFFREGQYIGRINPGTTLLDTANIPFLGHLLIDRLTDANHFICELFFVSLNETVFQVPWSSLGQFKDKNSANVVTVHGGLSYTVKVSDPARLVMELGGQSGNSGAMVQGIFNGRILNQFRRAVGARAQLNAILDVVSNVDAEAISAEVRTLGDGEFNSIGIGIGRVFDLVLQLDAESLALLRAFGKQESELALQAKGMRLATGDGFAEYNLIQGQRAALEGLGKGLGTGNGPMLMSGFNLGANLTGIGQRPQGRPPGPARAGTVLSSQQMFILKDVNGRDTGPFTARQIALMAISRGASLADLLIRSTEDPEETSFGADLEPLITTEYKRRAPPPAAVHANAPAFELALLAAARGGKIDVRNMEMLARLAVTFGLDADEAAGRTRVVNLARSRNVQVDE